MGGAYREDDAIRAGAMEVEKVGEIGGEIRNGLVLWFEQDPALIQPLRYL